MNSRRRSLIAFSLACLILLLIFRTNHDASSFGLDRLRKPSGTNARCLDRPIAHDIVLIVKTGASELRNKLPVHIETTFKCAPNVLIFSDVAQDFQGYRVHDALEELERRIGNESDPDSRYHRVLREGVRDGVNLMDLDREAAWRLDRFKNIPMLKMAYEMKPDVKWFLFIDADTWLLWDNVLTWLSQLDPSRPLYLGSPVDGSEGLVFAHGGSGYVISRPAARMLVEEPEEEVQKHFQWAKNDCCGDAVLGSTFREKKLLLTSAYPSIQGESVAGLAFDLEYWCHAAITFHHMPPHELTSMHTFESTVFRHTVSSNPPA
jgi:fringe-like protein